MPICSRHIVFVRCRKSVWNFKNKQEFSCFRQIALFLWRLAPQKATVADILLGGSLTAGLVYVCVFSGAEEFGTALADKTENILLHTPVQPLSFLCCRHSIDSAS